MPIEGTVILLNENGGGIPFQSTELTSVSRHAPALFRSSWRKRNLYVDESGNFSGKIPHFPATLYFHTKDGKHVATVEISPNNPTTDLVIELRPRCTVAGRLVDKTGTPLANRKITAIYWITSRYSDTDDFPKWKLQVYADMIECHSEGFFTIDKIIPGCEYHLWLSERNDRLSCLLKRFEVPLLSPEQYQQPFDLGDVSVPR